MNPFRYRKTLAAFALLLVLAATYWLMNARCFQLVGELVCRGDSTRAQVALTFDDAPVPQTTEMVLATLAEKQVRGTFFAIGAQMAAQPQLAQRIVAAGHQLANHSWSHPRFLLKSSAFIAREIDDTEAQIRAAGYHGRAYFRPARHHHGDVGRRCRPLPRAGCRSNGRADGRRRPPRQHHSFASILRG